MFTGRIVGIIVTVTNDVFFNGKVIYQDDKDPHNGKFYVDKVDKNGRIVDFEEFNLMPYLQSEERDKIGAPIQLPTDLSPDGKKHFIYYVPKGRTFMSTDYLKVSKRMPRMHIQVRYPDKVFLAPYTGEE